MAAPVRQEPIGRPVNRYLSKSTVTKIEIPSMLLGISRSGGGAVTMPG